MMQQVLSQYRLPELAAVGLMLFIAVFLGAVAWAFRRGSGKFYSAMEKLPFDDGQILSQGVLK